MSYLLWCDPRRRGRPHVTENRMMAIDEAVSANPPDPHVRVITCLTDAEPDHPALRCGSVTGGKLERAANRRAFAYADQGVGSGERVVADFAPMGRRRLPRARGVVRRVRRRRAGRYRSDVPPGPQATIAGRTSEVMRNLLPEPALGLRRGPAPS